MGFAEKEPTPASSPKERTAADLLGTDLNAIVAAGKQTGKRKRNKIIGLFFVVLILCAGVVAIAYQIYCAKMEPVYQEALEAFESQDYETASALFQQTENYKDSSEKLEAIELLTSHIYSEFQQAVTNALTTLGHETNISYDVAKQLLFIDDHIPDITSADLDDLTPELFAAWVPLCETVDTMTENWSSAFANTGYVVDCCVKIYDKEDVEIYESKNGTTVFNYIDIVASESEMYAAMYAQIVAFVDDGDYQEAVDYWNSLSDYYTDEYEDLQDYVKYAEGLSIYLSEDTDLEAALAVLETVTPGFRDVDTYIEEIAAEQEAQKAVAERPATSTARPSQTTSNAYTSESGQEESTSKNPDVVYGTSTNLPDTAVPLTTSAIQGVWKSNVYNDDNREYQYFLEFSGDRFCLVYYNYNYEQYIQHEDLVECVNIGTYYIDGANIVVTYQNHSLWYPGVVSAWKTETWPVSYVHPGGIRFQNGVKGYQSYYAYGWYGEKKPLELYS